MKETLQLVLDFDNTLFDTKQFFADASQVTSKLANMSLEQWYQVYKSFYFTKDGLSHYDFYAHLGTLDLSITAVENAIIGQAAGKDYLYKDVHPFLDGLPLRANTFVLTYGEDHFQRFKYKLSGLDLPIFTVLEPKGLWLARRFGAKNGIMIDDQPVLDLPGNFKNIMIDRQNRQVNSIKSLLEIVV